MNEWSQTPGNDPAAELELADNLITKADALLRKHRGAESLVHHDDLPILTDVVTDFEDGIPLLDDQVGGNAVPAASDSHQIPGQERARLVEHLVQIDTLIAREVETWLTNELPQLLSRELDTLSERLRIETLAHLRATLLPTLSDHIASRLDEIDR